MSASNLITLAHILNRREVLEVPRDMQSAEQRVLQWNDVINVMPGRTGEIDLLYGFLKTGKRGACNSRLSAGNVVSIPLRVSILPSTLGLQVSFPVSCLPSLGSFIVASSKVWIVFPHALLDGASSRFISLAPFHRTDVPAPAACAVTGLAVGNVAMQAWLASEELSEPECAGFGSGNDFSHGGILSRTNVTANGAFNFELEMA